MITARILADSINPSSSRLTSFLLTYPRFIHSEFMTHRVFSRNAASSRAIPFKALTRETRTNPALPEFFGGEKPGMQSGEEVENPAWVARELTDLANLVADNVERIKAISEIHKSIANRYLEPWHHITVLATATDKGLANFFALRANSAAQPEFQVLAYRMLDAYLKSSVNEAPWGGWHVPLFTGHGKYVTPIQATAEQIKVATARCARLSYLTFHGDYSLEKDIELHDRLLESRHMSPFEHCAQAHEELFDCKWASNFDSNGLWCGWLQYRKLIEGENQTNVDLAAIMVAKPEWVTL